MFAFTGKIAAAMMLCSALVAQPAFAGSRSDHGGAKVMRFSAPSGFHGSHRSGVKLGGHVVRHGIGTPTKAWRPSKSGWKSHSWKNHGFVRNGNGWRKFGGAAIAVVVNNGISQGQVEEAPVSDVVLENGVCKANEYCSIRLGRDYNSPKIITLNTSGQAITGDQVENAMRPIN